MFKMQFKTGNDAFAEYPKIEIFNILNHVGNRIKKGIFNGTIKDSNGNEIGSYLYKPCE